MFLAISFLDLIMHGLMQKIRLRKAEACVAIQMVIVIFSNTELMHMNLSNCDGEVQYMVLQQPKMKKIIIVNVYRPPQGNVASFVNLLIENVNDITVKYPNTKITIMGDFNVDMNDKNNLNYKHMKWLERGLKQHIQGFTRYSDKNSCIGLLFTNMQDNFSTKILDVNLSDHQFLYLNRKHTPKPKDKIDFTGRSYKNYDEKLFCLQLLQEDWVEYYSSRNVDVAWNILYNKILSIADRMCPLKRYKVGQAKDP